MSPPPIVSRRCRRRRRLPHSSPPCRFRRCHRHDWERLRCLHDLVDGAVRRCDRGLRLSAVRRSVSVAAVAGDQHVPTSPCRAGCGGGEPLAESGARSPCVTAALPAASPRRGWSAGAPAAQTMRMLPAAAFLFRPPGECGLSSDVPVRTGSWAGGYDTGGLWAANVPVGRLVGRSVEWSRAPFSLFLSIVSSSPRVPRLGTPFPGRSALPTCVSYPWQRWRSVAWSCDGRRGSRFLMHVPVAVRLVPPSHRWPSLTCL